MLLKLDYRSIEMSFSLIDRGTVCTIGSEEM